MNGLSLAIASCLCVCVCVCVRRQACIILTLHLSAANMCFAVCSVISMCAYFGSVLIITECEHMCTGACYARVYVSVIILFSELLLAYLLLVCHLFLYPVRWT